MYTGKQTIEWLYKEQLRVDDEWSIPTPNGFRWWADKNAQMIEVLGEKIYPNGASGYLISVRTDFVRNLDLSEQCLATINEVLMPFASMAGPVYDPETRLVSLCSLVGVYDDISQWMNPLISVAAVLQIGEARILGAKLAKMLNADEAISGHPQHGVRSKPDEMAEMIEVFIASKGKEPSRWPDREFQNVADEYINPPPSLFGTAGAGGFTVEFPYGSRSSLCQVWGDQPHPRYGNGLFLLQSFPIDPMSEAAGAKLALSMNEIELNQNPFGYGFGSYAYRTGTLHFTSFFPNALYRPGLLPSIYFSCAQRAREMSVRLTKCDWDESWFSLQHSAMWSAMGFQSDGYKEEKKEAEKQIPSDSYDQAIYEYTKAIELNPKDADAYYNRGRTYVDKGQYDQALSDFTKAIELDSRNAWAYHNRGATYHKKGQCDQAISNYNKALEINPKDALAYYSRAIAYVDKGQYDQAISDCTRAIEIKPSYAEAYYNRGNAYLYKAQYDQAISDYTKAVEINPRIAETYYNRGLAFGKRGQYDEEISDYNKALDINPRYAEAYVNRGNAYNEKGQYDQAISNFNKALEIDPRIADAYLNRGIAYRNKGHYDRAISDYTKAIELNPRDAEAYVNRGLAYGKRSQHDQAISDFNKAIEINANLAVGYFNRGVASYFNREYENSWKDIKKAQSLGYQVPPEFLEELYKASGRQD